MKKARISVIIPVYNAALTIIPCLKALTKQTFQPLEIIVVDDGSIDSTKYKVQSTKLKFKDKKLILLEQKHKGAASARNLGAKEAKGDILAFIDSDCLAPKDWLEKIRIAFLNPDVGAVGDGYSSGVANSFWQRFSAEELRYRRQKRGKTVTTLVSSNLACRKTCFFEAGGFPEKYPVCEDMFLSYQISQKHQVWWLNTNGVQHYFKNSLKEFLGHQYFFGKESTRFFLDNPQILLSGHHQSKTLHLAIILAFCFLISLSWVFLLFHLFLYLGFFVHLKNRNFSAKEIIKAYFISLLRDMVSAFSFFDGFVSFLLN